MDWCGFSVIPAAVDMRSYVQVEAGAAGRVEIRSYPPFSEYETFDPAVPAFNTGSDLRYAQATLMALERSGLRAGGVMIRFLRADEVGRLRGLGQDRRLIDLPTKKGLSSSASVCVALAAAVDLFVSGGVSDDGRAFSLGDMGRYADLAYRAERGILGVNCGQMDQYAASFGRLLYVDCSSAPAKVRPLRTGTVLPIVIGDTRQEKDTRRVLAWLGARHDEKEGKFMEGMRNIVRIVEEARNELESQEPSGVRLGQLMNENQHYLDRYLQVSGSCPVSPSNLDRLIRAALDAGALGAKLSGSGGGGVMVALCGPNDQRAVAGAIERAGGDAYVTHVAEQGVRVEHME